ncbi:MAG: FecR family protein [Lachnospiraceae bacterium]|nr:FecR family protein [Lachnospiraceae bacterium]
MNVGALLKTTKGKIMAGAGGTVVAVGIGVAVLLQGGGYRSIAVEQVDGTVNVVGERNNGLAYKGEHLYSGDDVTVMDASELIMCIDSDKYVCADANTHFKLEASDKSEDSRIKIYLDAGSELNELQSKLDAGETYEVDTPNSTMSVRGTSFRVTVYKASDGLIYTLTEVTSGEVLVRLKTTDGSYNGTEKLFTPGQSALIRGNSEFSEFVSSGLLDANDIENSGDDDALELAYGSLPEDGMERLITLLEGGNLIESDEETEIKEEVKDTKKEEVKKEEPEKKEEIEEDTTEEETDEDDTEEDEDNRTLLQKLADAAIASRNDDGTLNLNDGTLFDPDYYARNNPDVVEKFGGSDKDLLAHYLIFGKNEDRSPSEKAAKAKEEEWIRLTREIANMETNNDESEDGNDDNNTASTTPPASQGQSYAYTVAKNSEPALDNFVVNFGNGMTGLLNTSIDTSASQNHHQGITGLKVDQSNALINLPITLKEVDPSRSDFPISNPARIDYSGSATPMTIYGDDGSTTTVTETGGMRSYSYTNPADPTKNYTSNDAVAFQSYLIDLYEP